MTVLLFWLCSGFVLEQATYETVLNSNLCYDMAVDADGAWCATNGGVRFFSLKDSAFTRSFTNVDGLPHNICRAIARMPSGELWVGTDRGPAYLDPDAAQISCYPSLTDQVYALALNGDTLAVATSKGVIILILGGTPANLADDAGYTPVPLRDRVFDKVCWFKGDLWLGGLDRLWRYIPEADSVVSFSASSGLASMDIRGLDPADSLLVLNPDGVYRYDETSGTFDSVFLFPEPYTAVASLAHKHDTFYVCSGELIQSNRILLRYIGGLDSLETFSFFADIPAGTNSTLVRSVKKVAVDSRGLVWMSMSMGGDHDLYGRGIMVWDEKARRYQGFDSPGLNSNYALHVLADDRGGVWVSHWLSNYERGVTRYFKGGWQNFLTTGIPFNNSTKVAAVDSWDRVVFGSWWASNGITRYDPYSASWEEYSWGEGQNLNIIAWLAIDSLDRIWVSHFNAKRMSVISPELGEEAFITWPYDHVRSLEFAPSGVVWAATNAGLVSYTPPDFETDLEGGVFDIKIPGPPIVWDIALDGADGVWGVTAEGAFHWTPEGVTYYGSPPFPETELVSVDRDAWGRVYFLCKNQGVVVYDPLGIIYDTTAALWHNVNSASTPLVRGFEYTWLDVDRTGTLAVASAGGGVSLIHMPRYGDTAAVSVSVYPNPCHASFGLPVRFTPLEGAQSVTIFTVSGERVAHIPASEFVTIQGTLEAELDVSHLASGLYIAVIRFQTRAERVKFVILR